MKGEYEVCAKCACYKCPGDKEECLYREAIHCLGVCYDCTGDDPPSWLSIDSPDDDLAD